MAAAVDASSTTSSPATSACLVIGIAGGTGSGKTTIARAIREGLPSHHVVAIDHDAYYRDLAHLDEAARAAVNFDHPDSLDNELLLAHIRALRAGRGISKPVYDFKHHVRARETVELPAAPIVVVEGILTLAVPELRQVMDIKIFVDTDADIRVMRRIRRDLQDRGRSFESVRAQYYATVRPMHLLYVEPSKREADVIIPEGGRNTVAIELILGRIRSYLRER
ncbi:MAG: uridine kinase [Deltaproteobacteria bacterium]|nr:uridine kinase [Deltaproteobacteria bacterium]